MKRSDIAAIILISSISVMLAYFAAYTLIGSPSNETATVKTAKPITADIKQPDSAIFNKDAINPTIEVEIGNQ